MAPAPRPSCRKVSLIFRSQNSDLTWGVDRGTHGTDLLKIWDEIDRKKIGLGAFGVSFDSAEITRSSVIIASTHLLEQLKFIII